MRLNYTFLTTYYSHKSEYWKVVIFTFRSSKYTKNAKLKEYYGIMNWKTIEKSTKMCLWSHIYLPYQYPKSFLVVNYIGKLLRQVEPCMQHICIHVHNRVVTSQHHMVYRVQFLTKSHATFFVLQIYIRVSVLHSIKFGEANLDAPGQKRLFLAKKEGIWI